MELQQVNYGNLGDFSTITDAVEPSVSVIFPDDDDTFDEPVLQAVAADSWVPPEASIPASLERRLAREHKLSVSDAVVTGMALGLCASSVELFSIREALSDVYFHGLYTAFPFVMAFCYPHRDHTVGKDLSYGVLAASTALVTYQGLLALADYALFS